MENPAPQDDMKHQFLPPTGVAIPEIDMDDEIDEAIIKLMSSYKGYTLDEVFDLLKDRVHDPDSIMPTMLALKARGYFIFRVHGNPANPVYVLRRECTLESLQTDARRPSKPRKFRMPETHIIDPNGAIVASDPLDVMIWKGMQDYRYRRPKQIIDLVVEYKTYTRVQVDTRLDALIRSNRWFERQGSVTGGGSAYRLNKDIKCPIPEGYSGPVLKVEEAPVEVAVSEVAPEIVTEFDMPTDIKPVEPAYVNEPLCFDPPDTLRQAIWKTMGDGKAYTATELYVLLSDYGITEKHISPEMTRLYNGNFVTRKVREEARYKCFEYTIVAGVQPDFSRHKSTRCITAPLTYAAAAAKTAFEAPPTKSTETTEMATSATEMPSLLTLIPAEPAVALPVLFEHVIRIKGTDFTVNEISTLYEDLVKAGFMLKPEQKILETRGVIKGIEFTGTELRKLVTQIEKSGLKLPDVD
jgi:hypothetical protein